MRKYIISYSLLFLSFSLSADNVERCAQETNALKAYHTRLMDYKNPTNNKTYLELIREKNAINAALTLTNALSKITEEYYDYLGKSADPEIRKINNLQIFLQANAPAAHKMALATDMVGVITTPELTGNRNERFGQIRTRMQNHCNQNPGTSYCLGLSSNFWQSLSDGEASMPEGSHSSMVEHFIHVSAASRDVGRNFIQNDTFNQVIQNDPNRDLRFTSVLSKALDEAAKNCANRDILGGSNTKGGADSCLNIRLEDISSDPNNILTSNLSTSSHQISTLGDVVTSYFQKMETARNSQLRLTGELMTQFSEYSSSNMARADHKIADESSQRLRDFNRLKENLAGTIHGAFKLAAGGNNLAALLDGMDNANLNPTAAEQLTTINRATQGLTGFNQDLFKTDGDRIIFDRAKLGELLIGDKLNTVELRNKKGQLQSQLAQVNSELEVFNDQDGFTQLETLQNFTWDSVRQYCNSENTVEQETAGDDPCSYKAGYNQGLQRLMTAANGLGGLNDIASEQTQITSILAYCDDSQNMASQRELLDRTCSEAIARRSALRVRQRVEEDRIERRRVLVSDYERLPVYNRDNERTGETTARRNWRREGITAGLGSAMQTLLPVGIGYFQVRGSLLQSSIQAKENITFNAWQASQATFPQNNCHMYVCNFNSNVFGQTGLGVARNYSGYVGYDGYNGTSPTTIMPPPTSTTPSVNFSMPSSRPTAQ
jgi:hypothetical protein